MPKILYVEDNDDNVFVIRGRLTRPGFEVVVAVVLLGVLATKGKRARDGRPHLRKAHHADQSRCGPRAVLVLHH